MGKSLVFKLLGALGLGAVLALSACGGGGGDPGTPLVQPTTRFIMTPIISGVTMDVGEFLGPVVKISGGQAPYYIESDTQCVIPTLRDGVLYLEAVCSNLEPTDTDCATNPPSQYIWIQDSSYNNGTSTFDPELKIQVCVEHVPTPAPPPPLSSSLGSAPTMALSPGGSGSLTVFGGTAPYTAASGNPSVASVSGGVNGVFTIAAGNTLGSAAITVTDADHSQLVVTVDNAAAQALAVSPTALAGVVGDTMTLSVLGGAGPYTAVSSNPGVATVSVNGSLVSVSAAKAGSAVITITDATKTFVAATVTVSAPTPPPTPAP